MKNYQQFIESHDDEDTHYQVHFDREALAPGSSYQTINHYEALKPHLEKAGIHNVSPDDVGAVGYDDITLFSPSKAHAHDIAKRINPHLPGASYHYRHAYLADGGHHVSVSGPYEGHPEDGTGEMAANWESHEKF